MEHRGWIVARRPWIAGASRLALGLTASCGGTTIGEERHSDPAADASSGSADFCAGAVALSTGSEGNAFCAVKGDKSLWCWGSGDCDELGATDTPFASAPIAVLRGRLEAGVKSVSVGWGTTCAVGGTGATACWGVALPWGDPWCPGTPTPTPVPGLPNNIATIATGYDHACALAADGSAWCWGTDTNGELGDGTVIDRSTAAPVTGLTSGVAAISAGHGDSCAVKTDGSLWCWGWNYAGELGDGTMTTRTAPVPVFGMSSGVASVSVGSSHTCAVKTDGSLWCWGHNTEGAVGDGTTEVHLSPVRVELTSNVTAVATGYAHTCAIVADGAVWCWGTNFSGSLGFPTPSCDAARCASPTPAQVSGLPPHAIALTAGYVSTCALERDGTVWCWGRNDSGQLGDGTRASRSTPQRVLSCGD